MTRQIPTSTTNSCATADDVINELDVNTLGRAWWGDQGQVRICDERRRAEVEANQELRRRQLTA